MKKEQPEQTPDELEQEVIDELNLEYSPDENPNKIYSVVFPYQVRIQIPDNDDEHSPTEVVINTHSQEFFSGRNQQDVLFQKEQSDRYSKEGLIKYIQKYIRDELFHVEPEDAHLTYTGKPEVTEMTELELMTLKIGRGNNDDD